MRLTEHGGWDDEGREEDEDEDETAEHAGATSRAVEGEASPR